METVTIGDITAVKILSKAEEDRLEKRANYYAKVPMKAVENLPHKFGRTRFYLVLWMCSGMMYGGWFRLQNTICVRYGISKRMKSRYLTEFESLGLIEVKRSPGQLSEVRFMDL